MTHLPVTHDARSAWLQLVAALKDPDLIAVVLFCAVGLMITVNAALHVSDFGAVMEQYGQFP